MSAPNNNNPTYLSSIYCAIHPHVFLINRRCRYCDARRSRQYADYVRLRNRNRHTSQQRIQEIQNLQFPGSSTNYTRHLDNLITDIRRNLRENERIIERSYTNILRGDEQYITPIEPLQQAPISRHEISNENNNRIEQDNILYDGNEYPISPIINNIRPQIPRPPNNPPPTNRRPVIQSLRLPNNTPPKNRRPVIQSLRLPNNPPPTNRPPVNIYIPTQYSNTETDDDINLDSYEELTNLSPVANGVSIRTLNKRTQLIINQENSEDICCICQVSYDNNEIIRKLPCNHTMHQHCIDIWFEKNKNCPMCRIEIIYHSPVRT